MKTPAGGCAIVFTIIAAVALAVILAFPMLAYLLLMPIFSLLCAVTITAAAYAGTYAILSRAIYKPVLKIPPQLISASLTIGLMVLIPIALNAPAKERISALTANDIYPEAPITLRGIVHIDRPTYSTLSAKTDRAPECDALCAAVLFTEGVEAVIIGPYRLVEHDLHRTRKNQFRLLPEGQCGQEAIKPSPLLKSHLQGWPKNQALLEDKWLTELSRGRCIAREAVTRKPAINISIQTLDWSSVKKALPALPLPKVNILRVEISTSGNEALLRSTQAVAFLFQPPLYLWTDGGVRGGGLGRPRFNWGKFRYSVNPFREVELLRSKTNLDLHSDPAELGREKRAALREALLDPSRDAASTAFALSDSVFRDIGLLGLQNGDRELVAWTIEDGRAHDFDNLKGALGKMNEKAVLLKGPLVRRISKSECKPREKRERALNAALKAMPEGAFSEITLDELELLQDPYRRRCALALIQRQSDRGKDAVPLLLHLLEHGYAQSGYPVADAARYALAVLGEKAHIALAPIELMEKNGTLPAKLTKGDEWNLTLARLGKPASSFEKPASRSGTKEDYQNWLRRQAENFQPAPN